MTDHIASLFENAEDRRRERDETFEARVIKRICLRSGIPYPAKSTVEWLRNSYPAFPLQLICEKVRFAHVGGVSDLLSLPLLRKLPWYTAFSRATEDKGIDHRSDVFGYVFQIPHASPSILVLHNCASLVPLYVDPEYSESRYAKLQIPLPRGGGNLTLEPLDGLLSDIGSDWKG